MKIIENLFMGVMFLMLLVMLAILFWALSIPFWSDRRTYCKYYDFESKSCVAKGTYFCLGKCEGGK